MTTCGCRVIKAGWAYPLLAYPLPRWYTRGMEASIFTKIIQGDIPCHKVYEDELTLAFLDIHPVAPGHVLVVPKTQIEFMWDLPPQEYKAVMATARRVARHVRQVLGVPYVGQQIIGTDVPHAHVHVIPFHTVEEFYHRPSMNDEPNHQALAAMAGRLRMKDRLGS